MNTQSMLDKLAWLLVAKLAWLCVTSFTWAAGVEFSQVSLPNDQQTLRVMTKRSLVINSPDPMQRVSIADPTIASAVVVSPTQVLIQGLVPGTTSLVLWDDQGRPRPFELRVEVDLRSVEQSIRDVFPTERVQATQAGSAVVLKGTASSPAVADQIAALVKTQSPEVLNLLLVQNMAAADSAVLLQVRFAEVDRSAIQQLGLNIFSTGGGNTIGSMTTQQFGDLNTSAGAVPANVQRGRDPAGNSVIAGGIGNPLQGSPAVFGLADLANIFLFRPDINVGVTIKALEQRNLLQILAEPNVLALNGREASFLAGGEFPFPVVQGGTNFTSVTILFKEFGVRLRFTPTIEANGTIRLKVAPEVSALDFSNALTVSGFLIPALTTRRAETEIALRDGQTFAIAGLIDNRVQEVASKIPGLGDLPFIGKLFRSRSKNRSNTELLVMVSPKLVQPLEPTEVPGLPEFPRPFLEPDKFDGKTGETPRSATPGR